MAKVQKGATCIVAMQHFHRIAPRQQSPWCKAAQARTKLAQVTKNTIQKLHTKSRHNFCSLSLRKSPTLHHTAGCGNF
jgi:hypothetical protein